MVTGGMEAMQAVRLTADALQKAGCEDAFFDASELVRLVIGASPRLAAAPLTQLQAERLNALAARRAAREPLQYICGSWDFLDFTLQVGPGVLCPRADTEVVAETAAALIRGAAAPAVLDLCAGSGCLGLGVKRFCPAAQVTAVEKSPEAYAYLTRNAMQALQGMHIGDGPYLRPVAGDLFTWHAEQPDACFDLIVSNPPYLTAEEMAVLQPEVQQEPAMALDGGVDGLLFYRALARDYKRLVRPGGWIAVEIGWQQGEAVSALLAQNGWAEIRVQKDYGGNERCVVGRRPC